MPYRVRAVHSRDLDRAWIDVSPMLADALSRNCRGVTLKEVRQLIVDEKVALWVVVDDETVAALVCYPDPKCQAVTVWLMGGRDMSEWLDVAVAALQRYAEDCGYNAVQAQVRPGLTRILGKQGWKHEYTTMRLENGR